MTKVCLGLLFIVIFWAAIFTLDKNTSSLIIYMIAGFQSGSCAYSLADYFLTPNKKELDYDDSQWW